MFSKSKVSQSMIDAVNSVLGEKSEEKIVKNVLLDEATEKVPTPTGMKVYGSNYGNSMKARKDQTSHDIDKVKGPKDKEMKEELKGNQDKIDANHNNKIDAQDFKILRGKKKVKEGMEFTEKLLNHIREKKDVVMPEDNTTPAKNQDVADKSYLKDKPGSVKSDLKNLGRFLTGKKETNEEVESLEEKEGYSAKAARAGKDIGKPGKEFSKIAKSAGERYGSAESGKRVAGAILAKLRKEEVESLDEVKKMDDASRNLLIHAHAYATGKVHKQVMNGGYKDKGEMAIHHAQELHHALTTLGRGEKLKEDVTEQGLDEMINEVLGKDATAGDWIHDFVHSDNPKFAGKSKAERKKMALGAYYGKQNEAYKDPDAEAITTDTLAGRMPGGKFNSFKSYKLRVNPADKEGDGSVRRPDCAEPEKTAARSSIHAEEVELVDEKVIAGTPGWEKVKGTDTKGNVTDKSGAVHTPMSRAKDLARKSFKKLKNEMLGKAPGNN